MRYTITGRNIEVTPGLKAAVEKKIGKLEHFFTPDTEVIVALSAQKDRQKIEVTIPVKGNTIRAEESSTDMYVSIDLVEEVIEPSPRRLSTRKRTSRRTISVSSRPKSSQSNPRFPRKPACRWRCWDTISMYSSIPTPTR